MRAATLCFDFCLLLANVSSVRRADRSVCFALAASLGSPDRLSATSPAVSELDALRTRVRELEGQLASRTAPAAPSLASSKGAARASPPVDYPTFATPKKGAARRISEGWWDPVAPRLLFSCSHREPRATTLNFSICPRPTVLTQVDVLGVRYKSVNIGAGKGPASPN
ncbi:hypothetical protein T484DRAFT_3129536 [Baffinella frigidus]|nr:hypothetical protein T484DRAFT_3129536 [Cryptophyta sp. CCMP2293]